VSEAILKEYAKITTELNNLIDANKNYDRMNKLNDLVAEYAETRDKGYTQSAVFNRDDGKPENEGD